MFLVEAASSIGPAVVKIVDPADAKLATNLGQVAGTTTANIADQLASGT